MEEARKRKGRIRNKEKEKEGIEQGKKMRKRITERGVKKTEERREEEKKRTIGKGIKESKNSKEEAKVRGEEKDEEGEIGEVRWKDG